MNTPYRVYFVQDDVNETLEKIYTNEQRPFKVSVLVNKGTCDPNSSSLVVQDTDYDSFRSEMTRKFEELTEDSVEQCDSLTSPTPIVAFKLYR